MILHNTEKRVVNNVLINIFPSKRFLTMLLPARIYQNYNAGFGCCEQFDKLRCFCNQYQAPI